MQITDNDIAPCLIGNTVITTLTNHGYLLYTLNMLKSLKPFGLKQILIVTIDTKSYNILKRMGYNTVCIHNTELSTFHPWNTKGYDKICYYKLELIHQILSLNKNILLIDGDIVFQKDPRPDIEEWDQSDEDIWIQNDSVDDDDTHNMCTGYMFIRSNEKMIELYDDKQKYAKCALDNNDQTFFNEYVKPYCTMAALPLRLYPNGNVFYAAPELKESAILVHFNWTKGHQKMARMKQNQMWLLTPEEEEF